MNCSNLFFFSKAMEDAVERQRQLTRQRLEARRRKREDQQYEEDIAASIVTMAEKRSALIREKTMMRRAGHKDTVGSAVVLRALSMIFFFGRGVGGPEYPEKTL